MHGAQNSLDQCSWMPAFQLLCFLGIESSHCQSHGNFAMQFLKISHCLQQVSLAWTTSMTTTASRSSAQGQRTLRRVALPLAPLAARDLCRTEVFGTILLQASGVVTVEGDLNDRQLLEELFQICKFTHIIHLAAQVRTQSPCELPLEMDPGRGPLSCRGRLEFAMLQRTPCPTSRATLPAQSPWQRSSR